VSSGDTRLPRRLAAALVAATALVSAIPAAAATPSGSTAPSGSTTPSSTQPCGASTAGTVAAVVTRLANNLYHGELASPEVTADAKHVTQSAALLRAVANGNRQATRSAVHALVYHRRWHIVRLRVLDPSGKLLADVGGPYVIAPVTGVLRLDGRVIGSYVMSVQDDYGFTLLENHAAGEPIAMYHHGRNVADTGGPLPRSQPVGATLTLGGVSYSVISLTYTAFPSGAVTAVILVPPPASSLAAKPCMVVRALEVGHIAQLLAQRFHPLNSSYAYYATVVHDDTGATVILRVGQRALPGSQGLGPSVIPTSGPVSYLGRSYWVVSFAPTPPARIYLLVSMPPAAPSTTAG
jgi:hypothetical protein